MESDKMGMKILDEYLYISYTKSVDDQTIRLRGSDKYRLNMNRAEMKIQNQGSQVSDEGRTKVTSNLKKSTLN